MRTSLKSSKLARVAFLMFACAAMIFIGNPAIAKADSDCALSRTAKKQLKLARIATARYHNINNAIADGYVDINVFIPNMGYHYLKTTILDADFDPARPELLVYANFGNGHRRLVAVEYAVPTALTSTPPEGFHGTADHWHRNDTFGLWTLHAWIWYENPDGVFAELNPRVP